MRAVTLRPATLADSDNLFNWRNDPAVYQFFFNAAPITPAEHVGWLNKVLADPNRCLYIIINEQNLPIGQVRFDIESDTAEISISIGAEFQGQGYGTIAIHFSSEFILDERPDTWQVLAKIKSANTTSIKSFVKAGFTKIKTDSDGIEWLVFKK
ncbi:MAG: GNAT family N-acetyltransferase [bacterium]|nr:GNAT family N-acetyltransferase [bacterium]